ncbi:DUF956 family protein [Allofustis seminis]|uniref:DUF956 family protein n=1 Tax=Allofustis seminis TaxID=166939 RepID=UPI000379A6CC|nr:DUF956 family protein [Allofustis seminis]
MVKPLNTKVDLIMDGTSYLGLNDYGRLIVGDKGFEFYHKSDPRNYIQIPWEEVDYITASVLFGGRWIPRFGIQTKKNGFFTFAAKKPKKLLRAINQYIETDRMRHSLSFFEVLKRAICRH